MAIPLPATHLAAVLLIPAPIADVESGAPGGYSPANEAVTPLTLQELGTIAGGWGSIDPI